MMQPLIHIKRILILIFLECNVYVHAEISLVSWNNRDFGQSRDDVEMAAIAKVIQHSDIIAIQEVVAKHPGGAQAVARLSDQLKRMVAKWDYKISDPTQSSSPQKSERYALQIELNDGFKNIMYSDTAINVISNNGKDISLNFVTNANLNHPYFTAKIHKYEIGQYDLSNSKVQKAVINTFEIFYQRFKESFTFDNSKIIIEVCGTADGVKVFKGSKYEGDLGDKLEIEYFSMDDNLLKSIIISKDKTLLSNELYALLRGYVVKNPLENNFLELNPITLYTKTYQEIGSEFRSVSITFIVSNLQPMNQNLI